MVGDILSSTRPNISTLPGGWEPKENLIPILSQDTSNKIQYISKFDGLIIDDALTPQDCHELIRLMKQSPNFEQVSVQGRKDIPNTKIGSVRTTIWSPVLSQRLWPKIKHVISSRIMHPFSATDWWQGNKARIRWFPIGISPLFRFMRYNTDGQHYAHYDAGYIYNDDSIRTLQSIVIYLTSTKKSGATRFIIDGQDRIPIWDRNHQDWIREVQSSEIAFRCLPSKGKMLIFDHRICHDVEPYIEPEARIIIRADIIFSSKGLSSE